MEAEDKNLDINDWLVRCDMCGCLEHKGDCNMETLAYDNESVAFKYCCKWCFGKAV